MKKYVPDDDDPSSIAGEVRRKRDWVVRSRCRGRHQDRIACAPVGFVDSVAPTAQVQCLSLGCQLQSPFLEVDPEDLAPRHASDARGELPDETHPDDPDSLTDTHVRLAEAVHRNCSQSRESCVAHADACRHRDAEITRDRDQFGVSRLFPAAGDQVSRLNAANLAPDALDTSGGRVAERAERLESASDRTDRRRDAICSSLFQDLARQVRATSSLAEQAVPRDLDFRALGAGAHKRSARADQHLPLVAFRCGHVHDSKRALSEPL